MTKNRLEAFSDGVLAIIITIMKCIRRNTMGKLTFTFLAFAFPFCYGMDG